MVAMAPDPTPFETEVHAMVRRLVADVGGDAADITFEWGDRAHMWFVEVAPHRTGAAAVSIACMGDELTLSFAHTRVELWNYKRGPTPLEQLEQYLTGILRGEFEEGGSGSDRFARVSLPDGRTARVGSVHLPVPWALRRRKRFQPYAS